MSVGKGKARSIKDTPCGDVSGPELWMAAHEEVENAYDALCALEQEFQCAAAGHLARRHCGENKLLHTLNTECVHFMARQKMVLSPEWQKAWARFERAVIAQQAVVQEMRGQISQVTVTTVTVAQVAVPAARRKVAR